MNSRQVAVLAGFAGLCSGVFAHGVRFNFTYSTDVSSVAPSRGAVVEDRPTWNNTVVLELPAETLGRFGIIHWNQTDLTNRSPYWQRCFNEHDWGAYYGYDWAFAEDWTLTNEVMVYWMCYSNAKSGVERSHSDYEWDWQGKLANPYVTPYWRMRVGANQGGWTDTTIGLKQSYTVLDGLTLTPAAFLEIGDGRMNEYRFAKGADKNHQTGVQTYNIQLTASYQLTEWLSAFASVREMVTAGHHNRDGRRGRTMTCCDLTIWQVGLSVNF